MTSRGISLIQPGDVIGFSACNPKGTLIRVCTGGLICCGGLSHVGMAVDWPEQRRPLLCESTSLCPRPCVVQKRMVQGVQLQSLRLRILEYRGRVYHYPLAMGLADNTRRYLTAFVQEFLGTQYDFRGAIAARHTPFARLFRRAENLDELFCSEWVATCLRRVYRLKSDNASAWSPNGLMRHLVRQGVCRKPTRIK
jgi:hypothetical protein